MHAVLYSTYKDTYIVWDGVRNFSKRRAQFRRRCARRVQERRAHFTPAGAETSRTAPAPQLAHIVRDVRDRARELTPFLARAPLLQSL